MSLTVSYLKEAFEKTGLSPFFNSNSLDALTRFTNKMLQINENLNLTKWTKDEEVLTFHLLDSALTLPTLQPLMKDSTNIQMWMDLGTGCGFPGVVLVAAFPQIEVTLLDSIAKKTRALQECLLTSNLNAKTLTGRAEEIGKNLQYREKWDGIVTRAVADFRVVLEYGIPLLKTGGYLVNWMTEEQLDIVDKSTRTLELLDAKVHKMVAYSLPKVNQRRWLVIVEKMGKTSLNYPRTSKKISKSPL